MDRFLPYQLLVVTTHITQVTTQRYAAELGITIAEARVITVVQRFGPLSTYEVADRTKMDKAKISRAIKQLVATGHLRRETNPQDNRLIMLTLTKKGKQLHDLIIPIMDEVDHEVFRSISPQDRSRLAEILRRVERGFA